MTTKTKKADNAQKGKIAFNAVLRSDTSSATVTAEMVTGKEISIGKKVNKISDLQTLDISVQHAEFNGRFFSRHKNSDGTIGGFVEKTAKVAETAYIGPKALVFENAWVLGNAQVSGNAWVYGDALVGGMALVFGNARIYGDAQVFGHARVSGNAQVHDDAQVSGDAWVCGYANVLDHAQVYDNAQVSGFAKVYNKALVYGDAQISGDAHICGNTNIKHGSINLDYSFTSTAQVEEYLKSVENLKTRLNAIGAKSVLRK